MSKTGSYAGGHFAQELEGNEHEPRRTHRSADRDPASADTGDAEKLSDAEFKNYKRPKPKPKPKPKQPQEAYVKGAHRVPGGTEIVINRGASHGVALGDHGKVVGLDATFKVITVGEQGNDCVAFVKATDATFEQLLEHKAVILNSN